MKETQTIQNQTKNTQTTDRISGSEAVVRCLLEEGVKILYGYPGGAIMPFMTNYISIKIKFIMC